MKTERYSGQARLVLDVIGLSVTVILLVVALSLPSGSTALQSILINLSASFLFATVLDLLIRAQQCLLQWRLVQFFGRDLIRGTTIFVLPDFEPSSNVTKTLAAQGQNMEFVRPSETIYKNDQHYGEVQRSFAGNDVQAMLYFVDLFQGMSTKPNRVYTDYEVITYLGAPGSDNVTHGSMVSFGLSSNDCTLHYGKVADRPLFTIDTMKQGTTVIEVLNLLDKDGKTIRQYKSSLTEVYGFIVRYAPDGQPQSGRRWFLVAGLGARGTTGAAWFLSQKWWSELSPQLDGHHDDDFLAVVACAPELHAETTTKLRRLIVCKRMTGEILTQVARD